MAYKLTAQQLEQMWNMPPRSHYPDRSKPFSFEKSEAIQYIRDAADLSLEDAKRAFENLRRAKHILFDPTEKVWMGKTVFKATFSEEPEAA